LRPSLEYWNIRVCTCPKFGAASAFLSVAPSQQIKWRRIQEDSNLYDGRAVGA